MEEKSILDHTLNHLFRQESGKMVAVLVKIFGTENISMAEDVVQDALMSALQNWKFNGLPENPAGWLYKTARNKAIDLIRKHKHGQLIDFNDPVKQLLTSEYTLTTIMNEFWGEDQIKDDFLAMMFACCHPNISEEQQITFVLKILCGFSTREIAKSFLTSEDTISKRIYRTKEYFRKEKIKPAIPGVEELLGRIDTVLSTIYLMFNEGYNTTDNKELIREEIIAQAMLLCNSLLESKRTQLPEVYALLALMCFHSSRNESRLSATGGLVLLADQDRNLWNQKLINAGKEYLNQAAFGNKISIYHLEAAIAYEHCIAPTYEQTNWQAILNYYDALLELSFDPVVFLNRSIIVIEVSGYQEALNSLKSIANHGLMQKYYLYHAILGEIYDQLGKKELAKSCYQRARQLTLSIHEKRFLADKISFL